MAKPAAPEGETKTQKFERLATIRANDAFKALDKIADLAGSATYEYTPEHADKLEKLLGDKVAATIAALKGGKKAAKQTSLFA